MKKTFFFFIALTLFSTLISLTDNNFTLNQIDDEITSKSFSLTDNVTKLPEILRINGELQWQVNRQRI